MATDENFIDCKCPYCGEAVSFGDDVAGHAAECPNCTESLIVPRETSEFAGKIPLPIVTPRLILRRLVAADWKDILEFMSDERLFEYDEIVPQGEEQVQAWLEKQQYAKITAPNDWFNLGIELQPGRKVIGVLYLNFNERARLQSLVSIDLNQGFQGQGFDTEAMNALLEFCFDGIGLHRVTAWVDSRDAAKCGLFEKVGMRREGEVLKDRFVNAEWGNTVLYAMLEEEYRKSRTGPPRESSR